MGRDAVGIDGGNGTRSTGYCFKSAIVEELLGESRAAVLFENGNIAELAERMVGMATSTDLTERGRIAMEYAREFSINNIIKEWKEIIER